MLVTLIKLFCIVALVIVCICVWKTAEYFNTLPENNQYKSLISWDILVLFFVGVALVMKLIAV